MKPMHMVKSVTEQELIAVQNRYQDVVKKIEELQERIVRVETKQEAAAQH